MAEIKVNGRIKVKSFNKSFTQAYPYLHAVLKLPNGNNIQKLAYSFLGALYTQLDFADEAAFFSTKNHNIRNLLPNEAPIQCFREWFTYTFYTSAQLDDFMKCKKLNDW